MPNEQTPAPMSKEEILKKHGIYPGFRSTYTYEAILSAMDEYRLAFEKEQQPKTIKGSLWYCETCKSTVDAVNVTYEETHDVRAGGCGGRVVPDPYWSDPATWPEWANWTAVDVDGEMWFYEYEPNTDDGYNDWWVVGEFKYDFSHNVSHNPNWRNSLRSREEVSGGK